MKRMAVMLGLVLLAGPAAAQDAPLIGPETLKVFPRGEERCFAGRFDGAYRKSHGGQTLEGFWLYRHFQQNPQKEDPGPTPAEWIAEDIKPDTPGWVDVLASFSDRPGSFRQSVSCNDKGKGSLLCYVDCDGGSFGAEVTANGLAISFSPEYGLSMNQSCGDPDEEGAMRMLSSGDAGGGFRIVAAPISTCVAADAAAHPAFAADPVALRERLRQPGFRCLSRSYDQAHLKKHPHQKVSAIALAIRGEPHGVSEAGMRDTIGVDVTLSVKLRDGRTAREAVACRADGYQFRCGGTFRLRRRDMSSAMLLSGEYGGGEGPGTPVLAGLKLGTDDLTFRLDASADEDCGVK